MLKDIDMVKVKNVTKTFGKTKAIDNLSFELKRGDITGLLGPNGAGKTTTMRMMVSYYYPDRGTITIDGKDTKSNTLDTQKKIGYLPENNPLYLDMMVIDYLMMTAKLYGLPKKDGQKRVKELAKSVDIQNKLANKLGELSKGYKQRVGIAAALIHDPAIVILDEPTEGLDPNQREEIRALIKEISKDKVILISTHVMQEVKAMCNKVIVIDEGKLVTEGIPDKLSKLKSLEVKIEGDNIEEELSKLIKDKKESVKVEDKRSKIKTVHITSDNELRPEISKIAAKNKWIIWEMQVEDGLAQVFEELKHNENK